MGETKSLMDTVDAVSDKTREQAQSTKEIASSVTDVLNAANEVKSMLDQLSGH